jgi:glycosyltransferase involved in cell wall biosynthesis
MARNNGMAIARGEYILMPDSDDLLVENSLKPLLKKALETKVDLVVADFLTMNDDEINNRQLIYQQEFSMKEKTGEKLYMDDFKPNQSYVWRTLYKKDFITKNNLKFIPGIYFQDVPFTHEAYLKAKTCIKTSWLLNIYRRGQESASNLSTFNLKKAHDFCIAIAKSWELYKKIWKDFYLKQKRNKNTQYMFRTTTYYIVYYSN